LPTVLGPDGNKLSKSLASAPVDPRDPLPALRIAWRLLGQDERVLDPPASVAGTLAIALANFLPERIPATDVSAAM
jgi:glutamyl-Q tRNA(Asp) synthetase